MREADFPIPVYQEGDGETKNAAVHFSQLLVAHHDRVIQSVFLIGSVYWWCLIVHRDADDLQPPSAIFLLPLNKARHLGKTWRTPGSPEIEQDDLAAIGRQIHVPLVQIHTGTQLLIYGANIGTFVPRAAPAIHDDKATAALVCWACVLAQNTESSANRHAVKLMSERIVFHDGYLF